MKLRLDPWASDYGTTLQAEEVNSSVAERVSLDVERDVGEWRPITPRHSMDDWPHVIFVDGCRRIDARVFLEDHRRQLAFGLLGSCAVGAVSSQSNSGVRVAEFLNLWDIDQVCILSGGHQIADFTLNRELASQLGVVRFRIVTTEARELDAVEGKLQSEMLAKERQLAARLIDRFPEALIVCDGPRPLLGSEGNVVGYVKTIRDQKIPPEQIEQVRLLEAGQRSPLYLVHTKDPRHQYYEWFLRLRDPRPWLHSFAGLVRLQALAGPVPASRLTEVVQLADWSCMKLPLFSSRQHQDPRAPQQLLPIRALETELRRRMGHSRLLRRRITSYLARQGGTR
jgi:hypothetical protein